MHSTKRFKRDHDQEQNVVEMESEELDLEPQTLYEVLSFSFENIAQQISQTITDSTDFETLEVNDVPNILQAVNLISSDILLQNFYQTSYSIAIRLKIINEITTLSPLQYEIISTKIDKTRKFLLCLESLNDKKCCFYWKAENEAPLMMLSLIDVKIEDRDSMNCFLNSFLLLALRFGNDGLSQEVKLSSSTDLSLFSLADVNDKNLLMLASELGNRSVVEDLIRIGFDVNFQVDNEIAADLAWQNRHLDVLFSLLLENSLYPVDFNEANTSNEMKEFVKMTHQFVKSVKNNDEVTVQNILDRYPNLRYFYSRDNVSAAFVALSKEKFKIYKIFMTKNVCVGPKEDIDRILSNFNDKKREELRQLHLEHSREPPEKFLMILHSNTSVGHDTINVNEKLDYAKSAIEYLCRISLIRLILQVVAASRDFKLIFDFNRDSVQFLDPTSSKQTRGSFFTSRQIYIAAKYFLDPLRRQDAIGTLAHELCHYAMFLVYKNNCLPYYNGDHKMEKTFHGYLKYCHENRRKEKIIGYVFDIPKENIQTRHAELIVRVPHLLALYHENQEYLDKLRDLFLPLFSFFEFKVVEDMKTALPNIETEGDGEIKKFNDKRKRKGFFRMRNLILLILIASISAVGVGIVIYYTVFANNELYGNDMQPWNAIIRHSRTNQIMCFGSLIHPEFVLTTAECVQKKNHRMPLPALLFQVHFYPKSENPFILNVVKVHVYSGWQYNEDNLGYDISLLELKTPVEFNENLKPINLPSKSAISLQVSKIERKVLHTIESLRSFDVSTNEIETSECILDDYTINRFLGDHQFCARQSDNKYSIAGRGEQFYDPMSETLHGLVSKVQITDVNFVKNNSMIVTDLGVYSDSIRNAICDDREMQDYYTLVRYQRLLYNLGEIALIERHPSVNITKIILNADYEMDQVLTIPKGIEQLQNVTIIHDYVRTSKAYESYYYFYGTELKQRVFSSLCIQFSGGPIFSGNDTISYYGIVTKEPCGNECNIGENGYKVGFIKLYDHIDWILTNPLETTTTPNTTTRTSTLQTPSPDVSMNLFKGEFANQNYCIAAGNCRSIKVFLTNSIQINTINAPFYIDEQFDDQVEGFENHFISNMSQSLPIDVVDVFPNLVTYTFINAGVPEISLDNFRNLVALEVIALNGNEIIIVQWDTFNHTTSLRELNLSNNKISFLNENILASVQKLEKFWIANNFLSNNFPKSRYSPLLIEINLSHNRITEIRDNIFQTCNDLEIIILSLNEIIFLNSDNFLNKPNLMSVDLTGNICIDKVFNGSNGTRFTTDDLNILLNETSMCNVTQTTTTLIPAPPP